MVEATKDEAPRCPQLPSCCYRASSRTKMPLNANEEALIGKPSTADLDYEHQRVEYAPEEQHKIGKWTLVALILNRTIGSGIFLTPHRKPDSQLAASS